jgi:excisionase family DNA binding protein
VLSNTPSEGQTEYLMSPEEQEGFLGVSRTYAYGLLSSGAIPCIRIGKLRRVRRSDVDAFLEANLERDTQERR